MAASGADRVSRVFLLFLFLSAAGTGCKWAQSRLESAGPAETLRQMEDRIKSAQVDYRENLPSTHILKIIYEVADSRSLPSPVAVVPEDQFHALVLDNSLSQLYRVTFASGSDSKLDRIKLPASVLYPSNMKKFGGDLYIWTDPDLYILDSNGNLKKDIKTFLSQNDFLVLSRERIILSPNPARRSRGPIAVELDGEGKRINSYGDQDLSSFGGISGRSHLAFCNGELVAGMQNDPILHAYRFGDSSQFDVHLPTPGEAELQQLKQKGDLVHPSAKMYSLPTFIAGVGCVGDSIFVLADYPAMYIYELDKSGEIRAFYKTAKVDGRHFRRLAVTRVGDKLFFFTIATDRDGLKEVLVFAE